MFKWIPVFLGWEYYFSDPIIGLVVADGYKFIVAIAEVIIIIIINFIMPGEGNSAILLHFGQPFVACSSDIIATKGGVIIGWDVRAIMYRVAFWHFAG